MEWALILSMITNGILIGSLMAEWKHRDKKQVLLNHLFKELVDAEKTNLDYMALSDKETIEIVKNQKEVRSRK